MNEQPEHSSQLRDDARQIWQAAVAAADSRSAVSHHPRIDSHSLQIAGQTLPLAGIDRVIVVGAGHAGCEAARACARLGLKTAMVTMNIDLIAQMSCNPAIGGIAKGHLVREIDALGGIMGEVTDAVGIQFRLLNTSRGPAVWSPRAQCDKKQYRIKMRQVLESEPKCPSTIFGPRA